MCGCVVACIASKPRPSGWLWVETQAGNNSESLQQGSYSSSSSERIVITGASSSAGSSDEQPQDTLHRDTMMIGRDHHSSPAAKSPAEIPPPKISPGTVVTRNTSSKSSVSQVTRFCTERLFADIFNFYSSRAT